MCHEFLIQKINIPGLGDDLIRSKDPHAVERSLGLVLGRQLAADDAVLLEGSFALHDKFPASDSVISDRKGKCKVCMTESQQNVSTDIKC